MKFTTAAAALAALAGTATAAKEERTFAVLHFNKFLVQSELDPIVWPGQRSAHVHNIQGGSNFHKSVTGEELMKSKCSSATVRGDNSAYWYPALYFKDPKTGKLEAVELNYFAVYYFFEPTNEPIKAFPVGLQMVSGDNFARKIPEAGTSGNQMRNRGPINPAGITCPRFKNNFVPPSWPAGSDGSTFGVGDKNNLGYGVGFPQRTCTGEYSPMRVDIHFPSCYKKDARLDDYKNNMAWPMDVDGKQDCGEGYIHVPHLFFETYWSTQKFEGRWEEGKDEQPFVFANGDTTGYSAHGDFLAAWDEELLQDIIDGCSVGFAGMGNCPNLKYGNSTTPCTIEDPWGAQTTGILDKLPGNNPLSGFKYGDLKSGGSSGNNNNNGASSVQYTEPEKSEAPVAAASSSAAPAPEVKTTEAPAPEIKSTVAAEAEAKSSEAPAAPEYGAPGQESSSVPEPVFITSDSAGEQTQVAQLPKTTSTCKRRTRTETVWKTVVVTETKGVAPRATDAKHARRHAHGHVRRTNRL